MTTTYHARGSRNSSNHKISSQGALPPPPLTRRQLIRACQAQGWTLQPAALVGLENYLQTLQDAEDRPWPTLLSDFLQTVSSLNTNHRGSGFTTVLTEALWLAGLEKMTATSAPTTTSAAARRAPLTHPPSQDDEKDSLNNHQHQVSWGPWHYISAWAMPKLHYEAVRQQFRVDTETHGAPLFGSPEDKVNMLVQRYALVHQRMLRHELFRPNTLLLLQPNSSSRRSSTSLSSPHFQLTPIESLLGQSKQRRSRKSAQETDPPTVLLLGILVQREQNRYYLEDMTGQVALDWSTLHPEAWQSLRGCFITEHNLLLVEGSTQRRSDQPVSAHHLHDDEVFHVHRMGHPLLEARHTSRLAIAQQISHPAYRHVPRQSWPSAMKLHMDQAEIFILSDLHMDRPWVAPQLEGWLARQERSLNRTVPPLMVCLGNFCSPQAYAQEPQFPARARLLQQALEDFLSLVAQFPGLAQHARFCLVPGPDDDLARWGAAGRASPLPLPPMSLQGRQHRVAHVIWASNPCRWQGAQHEVVIFRYNLLDLLQRSQVLRLPRVVGPRDENQPENQVSSSSSSSPGSELHKKDPYKNDDEDPEEAHSQQPHCRMIKTILDQGHLVPVAGVPIYWNYDHALRLYPLPQALILADGSSESAGFCEKYGDCQVVHPGSWGTAGASASSPSYAIYRPQGREDGDESDEEDEVGPARVEVLTFD